MSRPPLHAIGAVAVAIATAHGDLTRTARDLGISRAALYARIARTPQLQATVRVARKRKARRATLCARCGGTGYLKGKPCD